MAKTKQKDIESGKTQVNKPFGVSVDSVKYQPIPKFKSGCIDILPRLKRVGFLCASAGRRIRYGLTSAPQFGDAPPKYILSRIEVAVVYLAAFGTYPFAVAKFQFSVHISTLASL